LTLLAAVSPPRSETASGVSDQKRQDQILIRNGKIRNGKRPLLSE
jgi:hypothetical protein